MKELLQKSIKLYGLCIAASFMCFILVITFNMLGTAFLTKTVGYTAYRSLEGQEKPTELYTYYYADGEDLQKQEYIDKGYTITEVSVRSNVNKSTGIVWDTMTEIFLIFMFGVFVYNNQWNLGYKDNGAVRHKTKTEDKLKGLKIGFIVSAPAFILLTVLFIGRFTFAKNVSIALFAFLNTHLYEAIILISGGGGFFSKLHVWQILCYYALLLIVPLISHIAYTLGYKSIIVSEKLIYKKK